ncbi:hypothetical protein PSU4_51370 [Pseudonocardia sulfidoxydans NBRC 16205]|uniref:HipA-like C-terminal domain-containing protein n=1 Tax=Pseudonocardia sulfidoxydans NBRC 16205 TaxID=1223511 RepID=A0A511DPK1_9PSEU|nr:HipA domain-containing protein [Pseudonocardia sulfidoxydans]GEL26183.1 hypothetical protein PSU4_51370 [Pseudonocardia sulfidoxydans NBRC 16205]
MLERFEVVDVTSWRVVGAEVLGRNEKVWVREPNGPDDRSRDWLFKPVVTPRSTGRPQGEDWAEKVVSEVGTLLGVPCAEVRLAARGETRGSISRNVVPQGWNLVLGPVLLGTIVEGYRSTEPDALGRERPVRGRPGHNLPNIFAALQFVEPPTGSSAESAVEMFAAYLVLDALVANQDRHEQNWAVLREAVPPGRLRLAPSFDHASSLGFSLTDSRRHAQLEASGIGPFAERGRAHRFEHPADAAPSNIQSLVDLARDALRRIAPEGRRRILGAVESAHPGCHRVDHRPRTGIVGRHGYVHHEVGRVQQGEVAQ